MQSLLHPDLSAPFFLLIHLLSSMPLFLFFPFFLLFLHSGQPKEQGACCYRDKAYFLQFSVKRSVHAICDTLSVYAEVQRFVFTCLNSRHSKLLLENTKLRFEESGKKCADTRRDVSLDERMQLIVVVFLLSGAKS